MTPLCELAAKHKTDKGGNHLFAGDTCHNYTPTYYNLFQHKRESVDAVLEIGVNYGCSVRMWEEFFPSAHIYGLDSNLSCLFTAGRITCLAADQGSKASLLSAMEQIGQKFDMIVDDGSHDESHQVLSAITLMPFLKPDGVYVIEDIAYDCQPECYITPIIAAGGSQWQAEAVDVGHGIGKAHCWDECPKCHGKEGERLILIRHNG